MNEIYTKILETVEKTGNFTPEDVHRLSKKTGLKPQTVRQRKRDLIADGLLKQSFFLTETGKKALEQENTRNE